MSQHRGNAARARDRRGLNFRTATPANSRLIENEPPCGARRVFQPLVSSLQNRHQNLNRHKRKLNWAHLIENKQRSSVQIATKSHFFQQKEKSGEVGEFRFSESARWSRRSGIPASRKLDESPDTGLPEPTRYTKLHKTTVAKRQPTENNKEPNLCSIQKWQF
jgi:hypothetical protein